MANHSEQWMKDYDEASKLADNISKMLSEHGSLPPSDPATAQIHLSGIRRRTRFLSAQLKTLESDHARIAEKLLSDGMMRKRQEMLLNLRAREKQIMSALYKLCATKRPAYLRGSRKGRVHQVNIRIREDRARGLAVILDDNQRIISGQRQLMKDQEEIIEKQRILSAQKQIMEDQSWEIDRLQEMAFITKHIALVHDIEINLQNSLKDSSNWIGESTY